MEDCFVLEEFDERTGQRLWEEVAFDLVVVVNLVFGQANE
jgi:hypothetical protein